MATKSKKLTIVDTASTLEIPAEELTKQQELQEAVDFAEAHLGIVETTTPTCTDCGAVLTAFHTERGYRKCSDCARAQRGPSVLCQAQTPSGICGYALNPDPSGTYPKWCLKHRAMDIIDNCLGHIEWLERQGYEVPNRLQTLADEATLALGGGMYGLALTTGFEFNNEKTRVAMGRRLVGVFRNSGFDSLDSMNAQDDIRRLHDVLVEIAQSERPNKQVLMQFDYTVGLFNEACQDFHAETRRRENARKNLEELNFFRQNRAPVAPPEPQAIPVHVVRERQEEDKARRFEKAQRRARGHARRQDNDEEDAD